jgi:uncharacterized protein YdaU (DUF1376 family)
MRKRMAKDPAMLWYWSDWHGGTSTLNRFLKGCYMDLLNAQFNSGHLSLDEVKTVLGADFDQVWPTLQKKFSRDPDGNFFNVRLDEEKIKRANFTASRRKNLEQLPHMETHTAPHMGDHMENVNVNTNIIKDEVKEGVQGKPKNHCKEISDLVFVDEIWLETLSMNYPGYNYQEVFKKCYAWHQNRPHPPNTAWQWREKLSNWISKMDEKKYSASSLPVKKKITSVNELKKSA